MRIFGDSCICKCASVGALLKRAMGVNLKDIYIFHKTVGALCKRALKRTEFVVAQFITLFWNLLGLASSTQLTDWKVQLIYLV